MSESQRPVPKFFSQGFRPFFLSAAVWSAAALATWTVVFVTGGILPSRFDPLTWHIHEMIFGFVMAAVAGFLLTAIPNWTGRLPVQGPPLAVLCGCWLLGRIVCLTSAPLPLPLVIGADLAFAIALLAVIAREIVAGRNWRNLAVLGPVTVLGVANLLMHLESGGVAMSAGLGWRLALGAILILIGLIGGRIIPSFTRNWLVKRNDTLLPVAHGPLDHVALAALVASLLSWAFAPEAGVTGAGLLVAAGLTGWRLARWRGLATRLEPLLLILHIGYGWLALGLALLGGACLDPAIPRSAALHALTAGAIGTMILAVMTRAIRGHTGQALVADRATLIVYLLVTVAAVLRVAAAFFSTWTILLVDASAAAWFTSFVAFIVAYGPMLLGRR